LGTLYFREGIQRAASPLCKGTGIEKTEKYSNELEEKRFETGKAQRAFREKRRLKRRTPRQGWIIGFLETYQRNQVCSKQLYQKTQHHEYDGPKHWQIYDINEIMNSVVTGWRYFSDQRAFAGYGRQKGWERTGGSASLLPGNADIYRFCCYFL